MKELTPGEARLYARWNGKDVVDNDEFWADAYKQLMDTDIPLPYKYNPSTVRIIHDLLDCPPGNCGLCCHYSQVPIAQHDIKRMDRGGIKVPELHKKEDGTLYFDCSQGCPFLEDNKCSIYRYRPDACWIFPVQHRTDSELLYMRVKCKPGMAVIREVITDAVKQNNWILLPNLICIEREA
ncbi:MAG: YkgJ family cysteine cluster protein [Dehalococcoidales bacterium]|nr:YkgJ family cysteine cluster protein [Dehalococcoidales bacterium]